MTLSSFFYYPFCSLYLYIIKILLSALFCSSKGDVGSIVQLMKEEIIMSRKFVWRAILVLAAICLF